MNPRVDEVEAMARAIDRVVFPREGARSAGSEVQPPGMAMISYLNEGFPTMHLPPARRERVQRRIMRALGIPAPNQAPAWLRLEDEWNRRLRSLDPRWRPFMGGAAIVLLGVLGIAYIRQRGGVRGIAASLG